MYVLIRSTEVPVLCGNVHIVVYILCVHVCARVSQIPYPYLRDYRKVQIVHVLSILLPTHILRTACLHTQCVDESDRLFQQARFTHPPF